MNRLIIFFLILSTLLIERVAAQDYTPWKWSHQKPQGNSLNWVKVWNANTWYMVGTFGTFMKTTNAGATWYFHHRAGVNTSVTGSSTTLNAAWFFDISTGVACGNVTGTQSITRTTNGGVTWDTASGLISGPSWNDLYFINNSTGYSAGTTSGRFAKTTNGGVSWTVAGSSIPTLPSATYNGIYAWDANNIIIVSSVSSGSNVRITTDGGATWDPDSAGTTTMNDVSFMNSDTGFVVGSSGNVWRTFNGGDTWVSTPTGNTSAYQQVVFRGSEVYVVGDPFNIYKSTNFGANWTPVPFLAPVSQQPWTSTYNSLGFAGDTMVIVGSTGLINRSTNNGANWTTFTEYRKAGTLNGIYVENSAGKIWAVGSSGSTGTVFDQVMFSSNGGTNWTFQAVTGSTASFNSISMVNSNTGYIGGTTGRVRKTTNGGTSWDSVVTGITFTINSIKFADASTGWIFGSTSGNIRKTTDGGATWNAQTATGVTSAINSSALIDATTGWLVGSSGKVSKTTDGGANWVAQTSNFGSTINDIVMLNANTGFFVGTSGTMRKTTNGGTNWDTVVTPVSTTLNGVDFVDAQNGFIVGSSGYTAKTTNGGTSWTLSNTGGSTVNAVFMVHADTAYTVGPSGEVHKYAQGPVGITWKNEIPAKYTLSQNYPNPFNPTTVIKFGLPIAGKVTLKVYDITGREVGSFFNNTELNAGTVTYEFDGRNLASGVYFYSLFVNNNLIDSKKMLMIK